MSDRPESTPTPPDPLPEPPEVAECLEDMALRRTFDHQLPPDATAAIQTTCEAAVTAVRESGQDTAGYLDAIHAATEDLLFLARYLGWFADNRGDGVEREEIPVAAAVLEAFPVVQQIGRTLSEAVAAARQTDPAP